MSPSDARSPGRLIVLEGTDGAGKTTQAARLADALRDAGATVVVVREPGATWLGEKIRGLLLDARIDIDPRAEVFLFLAARAQLVTEIRAHIVAGTTVIADRFFLSTFAYQVASGLDRKQSTGSRQDRIEGAGVDFHERVAAAFATCVTSAWQRAHPECGPIVGVDATGVEAVVGARVRAATTERWPDIFGGAGQ
jgi:thymidylate kinase